MLRTIAVTLLLAMTPIMPAAGAIIHVPASQPTIQAGINAAAPGDTVLVAAGTYTGAANRNLDFGGKSLVLRSGGGAGTTIIDCQRQGRGLHFHSGELPSAVVDGFTIRNGLAAGSFGGGLLIEGGANPTVRDCRLESNHANTGGGGFVASLATLIDCEFSGNTADNWGGGLFVESATIGASGCVFSQNGAAFGAGVYLVSSSATMSDCSFTENTPLNLAGGIYGSGSTLEVERCSFVGNTAKEGAGMWLLGGTASIDSCTFAGNTAEWYGGGLRAQEVESFTVTWCTFEDNTTLTGPVGGSGGGGGLYFGGGGSPSVPPHVSDCTFSGNRALDPDGVGGTGGGMTLGGGDPLVERCTFIGNHADYGGGGASSNGRFRNCVFEANTTNHNAGGLSGGHELTDCRFSDNHALLNGGGCQPAGFGMAGGCQVTRCEFSGNSASGFGGGMQWGPWQPLAVTECRFSDNSASLGGGLYVGHNLQPAVITNCTFERNTAFGAGGAADVRTYQETPVTFSGCTLVGNAAVIGGGLRLTYPVQVENTIIALGTQGEAVACTGSGSGVISCTDIYGNAGGDWTGCIADQLGINGCFSADPLFCSAMAGDYTLAETSPCAPAHSPVGCGLIGAHPVACAVPIGVADEGAPGINPLLRVLPNPLRGTGMIEWMGAGVAPELRLYDAGGRLVAIRSGEAGGGRMSWSDLTRGGDVASGVYFLELGSGGGEVAARARLVVIR